VAKGKKCHQIKEIDNFNIKISTDSFEIKNHLRPILILLENLSSIKITRFATLILRYDCRYLKCMQIDTLIFLNFIKN